MLRSILTTAIRNLVRNSMFSTINLVGLSVSMSLGMLIIMIAKESFSYDRFHEDSDRIYRVNTMALRVSGESEPYASTPFPLGTIIKENYTFAEDVVQLCRRLNGDAVFGNVNVPVRGLIVDPAFLTVFNFPLDRGNPSTVLSEPNNAVLTAETAERIFGKTEPLGQTFTINGFGEFVVSGVLQKTNNKTHFDFQLLTSTKAIPGLEKNGALTPLMEDWNNYYASYTYFKLKKDHSITEVEAALKAISAKYYKGLQLETRDRGYEFYLHPLNKITPGPELSNQMGSGFPTFLLNFMIILASVILLMSLFNFTNLTIAKSLNRAKEIGVRKVVGAQRWQVFTQFVGETVVFALIALVFSYVLLQFLKAGYNSIDLSKEFAMSFEEDWILYAYFIGFAFILGLIAGLLPAGYLSAFKPVSVLKDSVNLKIHSRLTFRKVLMVVQFTFSIIFVIVILIIYRQVDYMLNADYGINQKDILNVRLQGVPFEKIANEVKTLPGVINVGGVSHPLGTWSDLSSDYKKTLEHKPFEMRDFRVNDVYISNLEMRFLAGRNFDPSEQGENEKHVILNETALKEFQFANPVDAINQAIYVNDSTMLTVIGVAKDFNFRPLSYAIGPLALRYQVNELNYLSIKIEPNQKDAVVASLQPIWKKIDSVHPFEFAMMEDQIDNAYREAGFDSILMMVGYISFLTVTLACLGMLGMAMYATQVRVKEVGVRKVLGASVGSVVFLLSRSFMYLIGAAVVIGTPLSILIGDFLLNRYAYKITISIWIIGSGIGIVALLGVLIISSQTWRTAAANPVKSLKYE